MVYETMNPSIVGIFGDIGKAILFGVFAYWLYQFAKTYRVILEGISRKYVLEDVLVTKVALKKGIDIDKEMVKRDFVKNHKKSLMDGIQEEVYKEFFGEKSKDKE